MKQYNIFGEITETEDKYTKKIEAPVYSPKNKKPHIITLVNLLKSNRLIREIQQSSVTEEEKKFLIESARRHSVFNYELIADYYAHSDQEMQALMEKSGLIIIDFEKAIQYGYISVCEQIKNQYLQEYGE